MKSVGSRMEGISMFSARKMFFTSVVLPFGGVWGWVVGCRADRNE